MIGKLLAGLALVGAALFAAPQAQAQRYGGAVFDCSSYGFRYEECNIPFRGDVRIVEQRSGARCVEGETWGTRRGRVWVDKGCSGRFAPDTGGGGGGGGGGEWRPGPDWDRTISFGCGSSQYNYNFCQVDVGPDGTVVLQRQTSGTACIEGRTWGWNRAGVWVDKGCAGDFTIRRRWR